MRYALVGYYQGTGYVVGDEFELIFSELQSASPSAIIELFQLELNAAQHGADITYYFHTGTQEGTGAPIVFDGESYIPLPIQAEGFAYDGKGSLPRPTLAVSNLFNVVSGLIATLPAGLEGAKVTRIRTLAKFLDAVNFAALLLPCRALSARSFTFFAASSFWARCSSIIWFSNSKR